MGIKNKNPERSTKTTSDYYDMTEDASRRPNSNGGNEQARQLESDDANEERTQGPISTPAEDNWDENKVATSLDDES